MTPRSEAALWIQREVIDPEVALAETLARRMVTTADDKALARAKLALFARITQSLQRTIAKETGR